MDRKIDVEVGSRPLYPAMLDSPVYRWAFIRKIYSILAVQLFLTIAIASVVVSVRPIATFFVTTGAGLALYIVVIIAPFIGTFSSLIKNPYHLHVLVGFCLGLWVGILMG